MMPTDARVPPARRQPARQANDLLPLGDWIRHHSLRSWPVLLFLLLICVPSIALVILGDDLHASTAGLGPSIYSVGLPEELTKAIPVLAVALIYRLAGRHELMPRDYLFLGAVSGLVFGASEVVHYFTVKRLEPGQRPSAVDRGHRDQRHPVPGLR